MESTVALITVPLQEWTDLKSQLNSIAKGILQITTQGKKELLTPAETCELLNCSRNTFQSYVDKGILTVVRMQSKKYSKVLVKRIDVDFYLQSRTAEN